MEEAQANWMCNHVDVQRCLEQLSMDAAPRPALLSLCCPITTLSATPNPPSLPSLAEPVPDGSPQPTALFREVAAAGVQAARRRCQLARRYCHYYWLSVLDVLRRPRALRSSRATARM